MSLAAHGIAVLAKASDSGWASSDEVDGINDASFSPQRDMLDTTDFKDTSAAKKKMAGLKDGSISLSGDFEASDGPQQLLRDSWDTGTDVYLWIKWNGVQGHKVLCQVESFEVKGSVDGKVEFSASLTFNSAPAFA